MLTLELMLGPNRTRNADAAIVDRTRFPVLSRAWPGGIDWTGVRNASSNCAIDKHGQGPDAVNDLLTTANMLAEVCARIFSQHLNGKR